MPLAVLAGLILGCITVTWVEPTTMGGVILLMLVPPIILMTLVLIVRLFVRLVQTFAPN